MSIKLDIADPNIKEKLAALPENMADWAEEVVLAQAELMKGLWQVYINVDTGSARDSIRIERGEKGRRTIKVRGGGFIVNPRSHRLVDYMGILEAKYGAGRRAFEEVKPTIADMIKAGVVEKIRE